MNIVLRTALLLGPLAAAGFGDDTDHTISVGDTAQLRAALANAKPGATIRLQPGEYRGGLSAGDLRGEPGRPIIIEAADAKRPPVFKGGANGLHLSRIAHVELRNLIIVGASGNGINIDNGGAHESPSHHVALRGVTLRDIGPKGNRDGLKLSGVDDFRVENCEFERWGDGGSGIDMVGCRRGEIVGCTFRHGDETGDNGVQTKGGSAEIVVRRCRFEHAGQRAVNLGGSTGLAFFRPQPPPGYEARAITVEDCVFIGSPTPIAFVGVDGAIVRHNTIYRPRKWAFRILQETREPGFVPCRNGRFASNLIVFRSDEMVIPINIGPGTEPKTFTLTNNAWYCLDRPERSRPNLEVPESDGIHGVDPRFRDPEHNDLGRPEDGPLAQVGARPDPHKAK